jgi:formylglycine-generating enzyme required for sulfatase activity
VSSPRKSRDAQVESAPTLRASVELHSSEPTLSSPGKAQDSSDRVWQRNAPRDGTPRHTSLGAASVAAIVIGSAAIAAVAVVQVMKWRSESATHHDHIDAATTDAQRAAAMAEPCSGRAHERTGNLFDEDVCIPGGTFTMGSVDGVGDADERPAHRVRLRPFYMDRYEVTVARYRRCVQAGACDSGGLGTEGPYNEHGDYDPRGTHFHSAAQCTYRDQPSTNDARPINCLSYAQAVQVCRYEGKRLATEAEWERAARGLGEHPRTYPWGESAPDCNHAAFGYGAGCGLAETVAVGTALAGATPEGVYDLAGNVFEWTADWYSDAAYASAPESNPTGATPDEARAHGGDATICRDGCRVTRGGAWNTPSGLASMLRAAHRTADASNRRSVNIGVRCVR